MNRRMHAYLSRSKRSPLNANLARLRRGDPLFRRPALNRIYIYIHISRLIGDDSANRESIKQIVFGRPTRLFFRPIGVAFLLERLLIISSAAPAIESFEERGDPRGDGLGARFNGNHERAAFYYRRQFTFRKVSPISGRNHDRFAVPRFLFSLPPSLLPCCTTLRTTAFDLGEARGHNLIRLYKPAYQFDHENLVFPFRVTVSHFISKILVYFFERGNYAG